ncbi:hydroxypyruvate isomerase family protein [Halococcus agarilyticus]|uniref:hydroxypyruvate isomerase family protein n=1 Tax=Halococcus agarilyticus TaxID=1232219 RepID=UPI000677FE5C|nr:TIM barrel protein [Halococcus agarilyticus]
MTFTISANTDIVFGESDPREAVAAAAETGLDAIEYWSVDSTDREELRAACDEHGLAISASTCFGHAGNSGGEGPSMTDPDLHEESVADLERSVEMAAEIGIETMIVTVGPERNLPPGTEHRAIVRTLRAVAPEAEEAGVSLVVEPLNRAVDHGGYYLDTSYEAYEIVDAVDSPNVGVLFDVYHQQITEGNVIENFSEHVEFIDYFHIADVPGRHEPGTGEVNYENVLEAIDETGYDGYVGLEYSPRSDAEETVESVLDSVP